MYNIERYIIIFFAGIVFSCWASFLNMLEFRMNQESVIEPYRSYCPQCKNTLAWYDLVPIVSWLWLGGNCRTCKAPISVLYLIFETIIPIVFTLFFFLVPVASLAQRIVYFIFLSLLVIVTRSDLATMMIPTYATLQAIPFAFLSAAFGLLHVSLTQSIVGAVSGYLFLWIVGFGYKNYKGADGIGEGDFDLLAMIGAFLGPVGWWSALMIGSTIGSAVAGVMMLFGTAGKATRIPFGPFLSAGAVLYLFFAQQIQSYLFVTHF